MSEVRTGEDVERLLKEIREIEIEPQTELSQLRTSSIKVSRIPVQKSVGTLEQKKGKQGRATGHTGRGLWCLMVLVVQSAFASFARQGHRGPPGAPVPSLATQPLTPKDPKGFTQGFAPTPPRAALLWVREIADSPKKVRMLRPAKQPDV